MDGTLFWALAVLAAISVGLGKGGLPAITMLSVPILSLVISPVVAAGLLLPVFIGSDVFGVWAYRHEFDRRVLTIGAVGLVAGTAIGWMTSHWVSEDLVRLLIGIIGAVFAANLLLRPGQDAPAKPINRASGLFWTTIAGFTSFVSHSGAPPWAVWVLPLKLSKLAFAGTTTIAFAFVNLVKLVPYFFLGQLGFENLKVALVLLIPAIISVFIGLRLVKVMPERLFFGIVTWALLLISITLIWDGISAL